MALSYLRPWVSLLLADMALLGLLQGSLGNLLPQGLPGLWIEGTLRLGVLWGLLKVGELLGLVGTLLPLLCLATPLFFSLRALVGGTASTSVVRVASASWGWLLAGYGAVALSWAVWAVLSPAGVQEKEPGQENRTLMKRLLKLSRPDLPFLIAAFFFLVVAVWGETLIPRYSGRVIDILGGDFDPDAFASAIFFMCLFSVGSSFSAGCRGGSFLFTMSRINLRIREQLFSSLLRQDLGFFQETKTGELNSRLSSDTSLMSRWLPFNANILLRSLVKVVGLYFFMLQVSPRLTFLSLLDLPLTIAAEKVYNPRHQAVLKEIQDAVAKAGQVVREAVGGLQTVRSFGAEEQEVSHYKEALERCRQLWWRRDLEKDVYLVIRRVMALGMQVLILNCGVQQILAGEVTRGGLLSFLLYQEEVGQYVRNLVYMYGDMLSNVGAAEKVFSYLDRKPNLPQPGILAPPWLEGRVEFQDVSFSYPRRPEKPVLQGLTFTLHPGTVTALVGPNGSGKSTVAALLQNLYQPTGGQLLLDGEPLTEYDHHYLHRQVVLVGQEPVLFSGSVKDNIAYGLRDCEDAQVMAAAQAACADDFIGEMTNGINTEIGEKGGQLAVGQKQRLAIARALVRNPRVLILDEATSALDAQCEQALQNWRSQGDRTMLVIAHRLHTVQNADQVLVLKQGRLVEHDQLRDGQDVYAHLVQQRLEA
ncbi:antigen peptide transporter 2 [Mus musculus]|uniref:Antigen peptide transporter 2 n=3 Tax=Mus musculus TaxID=10090 RepID=TAP2_MOUSE|nr:antigen peptide transporter 2 [Mus musculus]P36371.1 RecName: Full=Antigen peptide transporter 2; Short=APT2; AltName: Full=ATP-binding cassette sub-family B member 3; AltName: Full=Histocompatibility antigen modifier 2 [Mus musculus]AAA39609.1 HAM2 [Mus musculus]AAB81533.1 antigen processing transporter TAP2 [Mus musculus]CAO78002.1 transporter 2, ATP-binding cassette, sub-family B (MDR/TAP) [Mus musculus]|eukprot:NP_035660.3 antigen peptide transporter 2 [Mus musculus]